MDKKSIPIPINKDSTPIIHVYLVSLAYLLYNEIRIMSIDVEIFYNIKTKEALASFSINLIKSPSRSPRRWCRA